MYRKLLIVIVIVFVIATSVFLYLKYKTLKTQDIKPVVAKKETVLDLRPQLIAKLQQMVNDGSDGLYKLSVNQVSPDLLASTVDIDNIFINIDSTMLSSLDKKGKLPDDIFRISFRKIHITGLGIADFLDKKNINIGNIELSNPSIEVFHKSRSYNVKNKAAKKNLTLYEKLSGSFNSLSIDKIQMSKGSFIHHNLDKKEVLTKLNNIAIKLDNILVDSSTQYDVSRYLFAKQANIRAENYHVITPDTKYSFKAGSLEISGVLRRMIASNVVLEPNGGRAVLLKKMKDRRPIFDILIPSLQMEGIDWWSLLNRKNLEANEGLIKGGTVSVYVNRTLPPAIIRKDNFPQQILMRIPMPISIKKLMVQKLKVVSEEYNPQVSESAKVTISQLTGSLINITNKKEEILANPWTRVKAQGLFMNEVPIEMAVNLNLARVATGDFNAEVIIDTLNKELINPISEPLSLFSVKSGQIQKGKAFVTGNNTEAKGNISFYYTDLHVTPLKTVKKNDGDQKSKHVTSVLANVLFIKNDNPRRGTLRQPEFLLHRDVYTGFVKLIWVAIRAGIIKSVGIPLKAIDKNAE